MGKVRKATENHNKTRFSAQKYQNRRFRKSEDLIFEFYLVASDLISVQSFSKKTGIAKSTFYRHHRTIYTVKEDYEKLVLHEFTKYLRRFKNKRLKEVYRLTLYFILTNKKILQVFPKKHDDEIVRQMIFKLQPKILASTKMPRRVFHIYAGEVIEVLRTWISHDCPEDEIEKVLQDIGYLTDTARIRLSAIR